MPNSSDSHAAMHALLDGIVAAISELDSFYSEEPVRPQAGPPAVDNELAALERHWGLRLPPSYRLGLSVHNGITHFRDTVSLLSTRDIIEDRKDISTFKEPFPDLYRYIFACGTESYDALAFDATGVGDDREMPVVELSDEGVGNRWPSFDAFLKSYLASLEEEIRREKADREQLRD